MSGPWKGNSKYYESLGTKRKTGDDLHVQWPVPFEPGTLRAESRRNGQVVATKQVLTAGEAAGMEAETISLEVR